ncbi:MULTISPECIES: Na+/H+ antiporter NhaC family protein [Clostridium]|jgi:Na+/H+ antiporter NhaC|uniref:Na+/H+ antiporter NhaC family protein n=1 Tax=Clostridium TaxID=1485 RepID=UPI000C08813A|nr:MULTISPECIES: Na+/H+ antiporter NhaC family protein [Clostridium]MBS7130583.1 Na+/H+ antiporter NhaC family protein [Clostridium sp.]MDB2106193.1 Na+/H+ antiporter NhaC family protein [Clostridium paraputrificum]MDB2112884.1 Na+/H+ antiporter NhaC family protein [Clostridium paraputrificum]MDU1032987.1 Na+/H+ antiporter NhaC family protein [Clostridium sp.]MDU2284631.1 Na+/H+ antiporter NhaC family protein [Clostridium sp.]
MKTKGNVTALLPLAVFLIVYAGTSIIAKDFYAVSVIVPFLISAIVALSMNKKRTFEDKLQDFCKGAGNSNVILMILIFVLAGAFAQVAKAMGAVDSTVNFGLSILPTSILVPGVFIIASFIALSVGTSMGTIVALVPIAVGISEKTGIAVAIVVGAVVSGAMFGDNLSMISDTTIAATRTQGCEMKDKFKMNFKIVLPAAIVTAIVFMILTKGISIQTLGEYEYSFIKILPYIVVLISALMGINVIFILIGGIVFAGAIGLLYGSFDIIGLFTNISAGIQGMSELIIISLLIAGTIELIKNNGGIEYILNKGMKNFKSKRGAELGIATLVSLVDICTANNTIAIVTVGPIAKDISDEFELEPRRVAGIMDMFSCVFQGLIPYGAQLISASGLAMISPFAIIKYSVYPYLMGICALVSIYLYWRKRSE